MGILFLLICIALCIAVVHDTMGFGFIGNLMGVITGLSFLFMGIVAFITDR